MKKLISVLLAILMVFSVVTVAFAADGDAAESNNNATYNAIVKALIGDGTLEGIPLGTAKAGLKIAKVFLKLAKAFIKVGDALGFIDGDKIVLDLANKLAGMLTNKDEDKPATTEPATQQPTSEPASEPASEPSSDAPANPSEPASEPAGDTPADPNA